MPSDCWVRKCGLSDRSTLLPYSPIKKSCLFTKVRPSECTLTWSANAFSRDRYGEGYVAKICAVAFSPTMSSFPPAKDMSPSVEDSSGTLVFSGQGWGRLMPGVALTNCSQTLRFGLAEQYCLPLFTYKKRLFKKCQKITGWWVKDRSPGCSPRFTLNSHRLLSLWALETNLLCGELFKFLRLTKSQSGIWDLH